MAADEDAETKSGGAVHVFFEYVLPIFLITLGVALLVLFFWIGPVAVFSFILSFIPKDPGMEYAIMMLVVIVVAIVALTPFWPPLMIVTAMVFGFWHGFIICWCAMVLAAVISFIIGRFFLMQSFREYIFNSDYPRLLRMIRVVEAEDNSFKFVFLFRFLYLPIWMRNYIPALLNISFWQFLVSVMVHGVMICLIFASTGAATKDATEVIAAGDNPWKKMDPKQILIMAVSLTATMSLSYLAYVEYANKLEEEEGEPLKPEKP